MPRICFGEFDWPDEHGKREFAQLVFLQALEKFDQRPLKQLYGSPFGLYRQAKNEFHLEYSSIIHPWSVSGTAASLVKTLHGEIELWARTWNLNAKWCTDAALATLDTWSCSSREITELFFQHPGGGDAVPTPPDPPEGFPRYQAYWMSRDYYLHMVHCIVLQAINDNPLLRQAHKSKASAFADSIEVKARAYCRAVEAVYIECGWRRCRKNEKRNLNRHLEWAVKFQVGGKTFNELAEEANVEQPTVSRAVREILSMLQLPKRADSRPGRIRGGRKRQSL